MSQNPQHQESKPKPAFHINFAILWKILVAMGGIFIGLLGYITYLHDARIDLLQDQLQEKSQALETRDDWERQYNETLSSIRQLRESESKTRIELSLTKLKLDKLLNEKWEEEYNAELLSRRTAQEQLQLLRVRYDDTLENYSNTARTSDTPQSLKDNEQLVRANTSLQEELDTTSEELRQLRSLYTDLKESHYKTQTQTRMNLIEFYAAVLRVQMDQIKARHNLETFVAKMPDGVLISELAELLSGIKEETERLKALENVAVHIISPPNKQPITAMQLNAILLMFNGENKDKANKLLQARLEIIQNEQQIISASEEK